MGKKEQVPARAIFVQGSLWVWSATSRAGSSSRWGGTLLALNPSVLSFKSPPWIQTRVLIIYDSTITQQTNTFQGDDEAKLDLNSERALPLERPGAKTKERTERAAPALLSVDGVERLKMNYLPTAGRLEMQDMLWKSPGVPDVVEAQRFQPSPSPLSRSLSESGSASSCAIVTMLLTVSIRGAEV